MLPTAEAVILTGGSSHRMGFDKAAIAIDGRPIVIRMIECFSELNWPVTILGKTPLPGTHFIPDREAGQGPLESIRAFSPSEEFTFLLSCDVPLFRAEVASRFLLQIDTFEAVAPVIGGREQPLCALYHSRCFEKLRLQSESTRVMDWFGQLNRRVILEHEYGNLGLDPAWVTGVNTPEELDELMKSSDSRWLHSPCRREGVDLDI